MPASRIAAALVCLGLAGQQMEAVEPCRSGPQAGQRPGPYAAVYSTGPQRGQSHCYICETGAQPAVLVFARGLSDPLGKLAQQIDKAVIEHKKEGLRAWVTLLSEDQLHLDPQLLRWSQKFNLRDLPLGVFEDKVGPPAYKLARDAEVTVLLFVKQKVVANFAFRSGELDDAQITRIAKGVPGLLEPKK